MPPLQPFERHFFPVSKDWLSHSATEVFALTVGKQQFSRTIVIPSFNRRPSLLEGLLGALCSVPNAADLHRDSGDVLTW